MKDERFDGLWILSNIESPKTKELICCIVNKEYEQSFELINNWIAEDVDAQTKELLMLVSTMILALAGFEELSHSILSELYKGFKSKRIKCLCKRAIKSLE